MHEKFKSSLHGYNKVEVNDFVNRVTREYESLLNKYKETSKQLATLESEIKVLKEQSYGTGLNLDGQEAVKRMAYDDAMNIVDDAKRNASKIVNTALLRAEKIESESDDLRRKIILYKKRFRNLVEENLDEIEMFNDTL